MGISVVGGRYEFVCGSKIDVYEIGFYGQGGEFDGVYIYLSTPVLHRYVACLHLRLS